MRRRRRGRGQEKNTSRSYNLPFPINKFPVLIHPEAKFPNKGVEQEEMMRRWEKTVQI
jgi:hypothetical protein